MAANHKAYKYQLNDGDVTYHTGRPFSDAEWGREPGHHIVFCGSDCSRRLRISKGGAITVFGGYSWDGCSPKIRIGGFIFGTPDGAPNLKTQKPKTWKGSLFHDALCQFQADIRMPYTRKQIDEIFRKILTEDKWEHTKIYYGMVRAYAVLAGLK